MGKAAKGLGIAVLAAAGTYYLYGKNGAKNRRKVKGWMLKVKGEVLDKLEGLKDINREKYDEIVDKATKKAKRIKKVTAPELKRLNQDLKRAWTKIAKEL